MHVIIFRHCVFMDLLQHILKLSTDCHVLRHKKVYWEFRVILQGKRKHVKANAKTFVSVPGGVTTGYILSVGHGVLLS